jgi:hypothetical protein
MLTIESAETVICGRSGNTILDGAQLADQANFPHSAGCLEQRRPTIRRC